MQLEGTGVRVSRSAAAPTLTQDPVKRSQSFLVEAEEGVQVNGQDAAGACVSEAVTTDVPAGGEVPTRLGPGSQLHPQLLFIT